MRRASVPAVSRGPAAVDGLVRGSHAGAPYFPAAARSSAPASQAMRRRPPPASAGAACPARRIPAERKERARVRSEKGIRWGGRPLNTAA